MVKKGFEVAMKIALVSARPAPHLKRGPTGAPTQWATTVPTRAGRTIRGPRRQKCCCGAGGVQGLQGPAPTHRGLTRPSHVRRGTAPVKADPAPASTPSAPVAETPLTPSQCRTGRRLTGRFPSRGAVVRSALRARAEGPKTSVGVPAETGTARRPPQRPGHLPPGPMGLAAVLTVKSHRAPGKGEKKGRGGLRQRTAVRYG